MCGLFLWGFWWIFPIIGLLMCFAMVFGFAGRGFMCMGRHRAMRSEEVSKSDAR